MVCVAVNVAAVVDVVVEDVAAAVVVKVVVVEFAAWVVVAYSIEATDVGCLEGFVMIDVADFACYPALYVVVVDVVAVAAFDVVVVVALWVEEEACFERKTTCDPELVRFAVCTDSAVSVDEMFSVSIETEVLYLECWNQTSLLENSVLLNAAVNSVVAVAVVEFEDEVVISADHVELG